MFLDGSFGAVCAANFGNTDADVACRQLGFVGGGFVVSATVALTDAELMVADLPIVFEVPSCNGSEARLLDCPTFPLGDGIVYGDYTYRSSTCNEQNVLINAFVACGSASGPEDGDLRLVGGATSEDGLSQFGRLEFANAGGWGLVCDRFKFTPSFTAEDAQVACRSLGFTDGIVITPGDVDDEAVLLLPFWLTGSRCAGNESSLQDCPGFEQALVQAVLCAPQHTVELVCSSGPNPELDGRLRLMEGSAGPGYEYGRLEIFVRGFWSTVCDKRGFTPEATGVACRALGFDGGAVLQFVQPYSRLGRENEVLVANIPPGISTVDCDGTETSLLDCISSEGFGIQGECSVPVANSPANDATVLACGLASDSCDIVPPAEQGSVRLVGGFGTPCDPLHSGIVEVFNAGEWGAICDGDDSRTRDFLVADVVCRQLGFPHGTVVDNQTARPDLEFEYYSSDEFSEEAQEPQDRFWLDEVRCRGPEQRVVDCDLGVGFQAAGGPPVCAGNDLPLSRLRVACRQFAVAEALEDVVTLGAEEGDLRLVGLTSVANWEIGRLEVFFEGSWSQVCAATFIGPDATVACRQLGFTAAGSRAAGLVPIVDPNTGPATPEVALTIPGCSGNEASLLECAPGDGLPMPNIRQCREPDPNQFGRPVPFTDRSPGLQLACVATAEQGQEGALRLVDRTVSGNTTSGILEVFHAGAWGTFCENDDLIFFTRNSFPERAARVACRQQGLPAPEATFEFVAPDAAVTRPPSWLNAPSCRGSEGRLTACGDLPYADIGQCNFFLRLVCTAS